ncbi:LysR family transcriptional regulator [Dyella caseinilytica]|uniref:LysR family transcriptional regulator n=1 Tax=Dyella caseinilytica TaxID=1849581 RepID=A0ABX7GPP2_9GAMM|nr:LysR family transcriptional regulator [Dyella caseinilytica]QRN52215.1 LysR family transcriptional regulator [Dyella caseinilytica]
MDRFLSMQAFAKVVEAGSFVRGAEKLGMSTTSVSRLIAELEEHLGTRLLQRTTRRLHLTDAGHRFIERATQLLTDLQEAEAEVGSATTTPRGRLRISVPLTFGVRHLAELFPRYRMTYPEVELEVHSTDRRVDLIEEGFDLALRLSLEIPPTYVARPLTVVRLVVCAAPDYLKRHGTPRAPQDLAEHNCLTLPSGGFEGRWPLQDADGVVTTVRVRGDFRADSGDLLRSAALAGQGIILLPTFIVGDDLARGDLVPLLPTWRPPHTDAMIIYPTRRFVSAKVHTFTEFLQQQFAGDPPWDRWMTVRHRPDKAAK